jgi:four helix bundle protein
MDEVEKGKITTYRDLICWQKSMLLVTEVYRQTGKFPRDEIYGLTGQIRRCAVSIPSNIAEGYGRNSTNDYIRFLQIASGSINELETQLEIACNLTYLDRESFEVLYDNTREIERMLSTLIKKIRR